MQRGTQGYVAGAARAHVRRKWRTGRGHVAGGHAGPREAQVAHRARTHGRRPRGSTRMPMRGATWHEGWRVKGHRLVGPGNMIGAVTQ